MATDGCLEKDSPHCEMVERLGIYLSISACSYLLAGRWRLGLPLHHDLHAWAHHRSRQPATTTNSQKHVTKSTKCLKANLFKCVSLRTSSAQLLGFFGMITFVESGPPCEPKKSVKDRVCPFDFFFPFLPETEI